MGQPSTPPTPFLGGGPKFNQAGNNTPMPGEKRADTPPPPPFGGPRVWFGGAVLVLLVLVLYLVWGNGLMGVGHIGGHGSGMSASDHDAGSINPDSN
jgi:hypothetical protein